MKCLFQIADHDVYSFSMPVVSSNMYLIPANGRCLVIDPAVSEQAEQLLQQCRTEQCTILLTHEHFDHISGVNRFKELFECQVICSQTCAERVEDSRKNAAAYFQAMFFEREKDIRRYIAQTVDADYVCHADMVYKGQMELKWEDLTIRLTEAPGHSPGSQIFETGEHWYFTGDSWIPGHEVITRLPGGSKKIYEKCTLPYLEHIAPESIIFPGHGEACIYVDRNDGGRHI